MSRDSFINREKNKSKGYIRAPKMERELAKASGGRLVPRSGAGPKKGDVEKAFGVFRVEAKTTTKKSFSVTKQMYYKLEESSTPHGEIPAIVIEFINELGLHEMSLAIVPAYALEAIGGANAA
jgi:hypothetical protein